MLINKTSIFDIGHKSFSRDRYLGDRKETYISNTSTGQAAQYRVTNCVQLLNHVGTDNYDATSLEDGMESAGY